MNRSMLEFAKVLSIAHRYLEKRHQRDFVLTPEINSLHAILLKHRVHVHQDEDGKKTIEDLNDGLVYDLDTLALVKDTNLCTEDNSYERLAFENGWKHYDDRN